MRHATVYLDRSDAAQQYNARMAGWTSHIINRKAVVRLGKFALFLVALAALAWRIMFYVPGESYAGVVQVQPTAASDELRAHVQALAGEIGARGTFNKDAFEKAASYIEQELRSYGYAPLRLGYSADGVESNSIEVMIRGRSSPEKILVVGAHYDTAFHTPGANDNASGVAMMLALAKRMAQTAPEITLRFVAFANEEPPFFQTDQMGSMVYAAQCKARGDDIVGMLALETLGYFSDEPGSQRYPSPFDKIYPDTGNFIAFVSNVPSRLFMHETIAAFRRHAQFPSEAGAVPGLFPGVGWSDHWAFWQQGYPAIMVTDTAPFRYGHYHRSTDTPDRLDYPRMAIILEGLRGAVAELTGAAD